MNDAEEFYNAIKLKYDLITKSEETLQEELVNEDAFLNFLEGLEILFNKEEAFLYLSSAFFTKIRNIIDKKRFTTKNIALLQEINNIIVKINELEAVPTNIKRIKAFNYINYQNEIRHIHFADLKNFLGAMALDYEVLSSLLKEDVRNYPNDEIFLSSTNYFLEVEPSLYDNSELRYITRKKLEDLKLKKYSFKDRHIKKYVNLTNLNFRNLWWQ